MSTHAAAEESIKKVAVPAGSLKAALKMLAEQSGVEFFYSTDQLEGLRTEGVNGEFTAEKAVQKLLEGTNLKLTRHESGALVITVPDKAAAADAVPDALEEIVVTALKSGAVALEKAPISVTALGGDMLRDGGFLDIADAIRFAPSVNEGVSSGNRGEKVINIRGIGQNANISGGTTAYYVGEAAFFDSVRPRLPGYTTSRVSKYFAARNRPSMAMARWAAWFVSFPMRPI